MKKTSRRNFAKTMTAALAAAPVAFLTDPDAKAHTPSKSSQVRTSREQARFHQDTPPPIEILDGSLIVESADKFTGTDTVLTLKSAPIEHIRVIADNGDKLYEDLEASEVDPSTGEVTSSTIDIVVINEDKVRSNVKIVGGVKIGPDKFLQITSDKKIKFKSTQKKRRKFRYEHEGNGGKDVHIESIEITNVRGRKTKFTVATSGNGEDFIGEDFRILIWRD